MTISFERVDPVVDGSAIERFLTTDTWPFHSAPTLSGNDVANMSFRSHAVDSYWIVDGGRAVGLVRLLELDDIEGEGGDGSPIFDLRVGAADRGRGLGTMAVAWLTGHLFTTYPRLHRVEATTRADNLAMQTVFGRCGYELEGRLRQSWRDAGDGTRHDTLLYAVLRPDWERWRAPSSGGSS